MATAIEMVNDATGVTKTGYYGFSWTTLLLGIFPPLFRGDFLTFFGLLVAIIAVGIPTSFIGAPLVPIVWSFIYNDYYTRKLLERGYKFKGTQQEIKDACQALGVSLEKSATSTSSSSLSLSEQAQNEVKVERDLQSKKYQLYLVEKYGIRKNDVLGTFSVNDEVFDNIEMALSFANDLDQTKEKKPDESVPEEGTLGEYNYQVRDGGRVVLIPNSPFKSPQHFNSFEEAKAFARKN